MNARVVSIEWEIDKLDDAIAFFRNRVATALKKQAGFANTRMLVDKQSSKGMLVTVWESEDALKASETNGFLN